MKLVIAIINERDRKGISKALLKEGFRFTKVASLGGFLRDTNVTLLIGVHDEDIDRVLGIIKSTASPRQQKAHSATAGVGEVSVGGAVCFVVDVEKTESL